MAYTISPTSIGHLELAARVYQFHSSSSSIFFCEGVGDDDEFTTLGIKGALSVDCSGSSSSKEAEEELVGSEERGEDFCIGEGPADGVGDARAANRDWETSDRRREARFWDFVNLCYRGKGKIEVQRWL